VLTYEHGTGFQTWHTDPKHRASFGQLAEELKDITARLRTTPTDVDLMCSVLVVAEHVEPRGSDQPLKTAKTYTRLRALSAFAPIDPVMNQRSNHDAKLTESNQMAQLEPPHQPDGTGILDYTLHCFRKRCSFTNRMVSLSALLLVVFDDRSSYILFALR
jgi:hypothetical protein